MEMLHIRYDGSSREIPLAEVGLALDSATDAVFAAAANLLDVSRESFAGYELARTDSSIVIHPEAQYG